LNPAGVTKVTIKNYQNPVNPMIYRVLCFLCIMFEMDFLYLKVHRSSTQI